MLACEVLARLAPLTLNEARDRRRGTAGQLQHALDGYRIGGIDRARAGRHVSGADRHIGAEGRRAGTMRKAADRRVLGIESAAVH